MLRDADGQTPLHKALAQVQACYGVGIAWGLSFKCADICGLARGMQKPRARCKTPSQWRAC